ncbi:STAS domain-containing protein [Nonomuraea sp. MTCD27]|uniref:STAS domain-containing protein n=1 Tax=Nonomuraea sp. MTCD27 TaxID=1676747 RepID=UPI0035BEF9A7
MNDTEHGYNLNLTISDHGHCTALTVSGTLDRVSTPVMTAYVDAVWTRTPGPRLILDLGQVRRCDYHAVAVFAHALHRRSTCLDATIVLVGVTGRLQRILRRTRLLERFDHAATRAEACTALQPRLADSIGTAPERRHLSSWR